jgi:CRISPR-associated protein Csd1
MPIAATHRPKIQGVPNAQPSGAAIVSFDKPAFASYGFDQSHNAPCSTAAASAYCHALKFLLNQKDHNLRIGQTSVCFWARGTIKESSFFARMLNRPDPESVAEFLKAPWAGVDREFAKHDQFYSVTLSGNAGRIVVRHWMQTTLEAARENLRQWFADLEIVSYGNPAVQEKRKRKAKTEGNTTEKDSGMPPLALFRLACTTVREAKDLQAETPAQLYRAALEGTAPSLILLKPILIRLDADLARYGTNTLLNTSRFALMRLILNRNRKENEPMIEPKVFETDDPAYNCGRLLAVLAEAQQKAHEYKLEGAGIAERYFGTACSSPASVFPLLMRLNRHHLNKIRKSDRYKGHERFLEEAIQQILALFKPESCNQPPKFPRVLDLQAQGRFALGFYQQQAADDAAHHAAKSGNSQP